MSMAILRCGMSGTFSVGTLNKDAKEKTNRYNAVNVRYIYVIQPITDKSMLTISIGVIVLGFRVSRGQTNVKDAIQ